MSMSVTDGPVVRITQGDLRGRYFTTDDGVIVNSFQAIPYARPPLGKLRFQAPEPPEPWVGIRDCTKQESKSECIHRHYFNKKLRGSEDCLFLNVYTPRLLGCPLPVMFFVHGNGFLGGSGSTEFYGPDYLVEQDVIVVTINFRLGSLGFLSLDTAKAPGNIGLKDQVAALRWVRDNISAFGGDPNNVTVFGESSGAACVHYLMVTDSTRGLFHKAITQSGCALNPWSLQKNPRERAMAMCTILGHPTADLDDAFEFLQSIPVMDLIEAQEKVITPKDKHITLGYSIVPIIENKYPGIEPFITESVLEQISKGKFHNVPYLTGFNTAEGIIYLHKTDEYYKDLNANFERYLPPILHVEQNCEQAEKIGKKIKKYYFKNDPITAKSNKEYVMMRGDSEFVYGIYKTAQIQASLSSAPTWMYRLSHEELGMFKKLFNVDIPGVCHGEELLYLFKADGMPIPPTSVPIMKNTKQRIVKLWTNFAKTGNPTPQPDELIPIKWEPITKDKFNYLDIGETLSLEQNPEAERMAFWDELLQIVKKF